MRVENVFAAPSPALAQGLIWFDEAARVVDLNLQAAQMLRADPGWMLMQDFFSLCGKASPDTALLSEWQDIHRGRISGVEHALMAQNGAQVWVALAFSRRAGAPGGDGDRILALALNMETFR